MGKALYRKYRSKKLSEIVGQEHVTTALNNALKNGTISHAYLFTGPRGTGKTSIARILAHEVNGLPYDEDATHLDIIEIDAASNRRIDEIRTLRERVHNAPTSAKYKVYIIDEAHMLTKEAFNALLKTLEEPPAHVIFILATTEAHKLPDTIISRTQRYTFKPAEVAAAAKHLGEIAKKEKLDISPEALELIATHGNGSFRDSISLLDQVKNAGSTIDLAAAEKALGIAPKEAIQQLVDIIAKADSAELISLLKNLRQQGYEAPQIAKQLATSLRQSLLEGTTQLSNEDCLHLLQRLLTIPASHDPDTLLEIVLLEVVLPKNAVQVVQQPVPTIQPVVETPESPAPATKPEPKPEPKADTPPPAPEPEPAPVVETPKPAIPIDASNFEEVAWQNILLALKQKYNTLYSIARMATPVMDNGKLVLSFEFAFHQKRFNDPKNKTILNQLIREQVGSNIELVCIVENNKNVPNNSSSEITEKPNTSPLDDITSVFGGGEILDS